MSLHQLVLAALLTLSPLDGPRFAFPGWAETPWERGARYMAIASDVATATRGACGDRGDACELGASALLLGLAMHESGFAPDVDAGRCYRGRDGTGPRCDGGRAVSLWQLQGSAEERKMWAADRVQAARAALRKAWRSLGACRALPPEERLAAYAGGRCDNSEGRRRARELHSAVTRAGQAMRNAPTP